MAYINRPSNYDRYPEIRVRGYGDQAVQGYERICGELKAKEASVITVECYPGVDEEEVLAGMKKYLCPDRVILSRKIFYSEARMTEMMKPYLTDDRVFGTMFYGCMEDFVDGDRLEAARQEVGTDGLTLILGVGASLVSEGDLLVYADMARWEIQLRYRKGMPNFNCSNYGEDTLRKYKRGFFVEWRFADKKKTELYNRLDYYLDTNRKDDPRMITGGDFLLGIRQAAGQPFRLVPYFDPGVWGGQWMKEVCGLDRNQKNFAWSFDGVPEENSVYLNYGGVRIESPAMNVVKYCPKELLGAQNFVRFGAEFPIRFDLLDTMGGQNLSLQVHPVTEYIHSMFGMAYTQDESYYILDAGEDGGVYLGLKDGIDPERMISELKAAQRGEKSFDAEKYVNYWPAKKHDHFLIPAGTVHCSSGNSMVLEVSATPYIFTFKLWDWDRVGLDGKPRPVHVEHGEKVIQWDRTTEWVRENLVNHFRQIKKTEDYEEISTGLHKLEFIETRVSLIRTEEEFDTDGGVVVGNLVEGDAALIICDNPEIEPFEVHYAETFIIPASVGKYRICAKDAGRSVRVLRAYVRH